MIIKNSLVLAFFGILSLLLAVFRDRLLATVVGVGPLLDMYNASFRIPDLLYGLMLAFISSGTVIPYLTKEDSHGHQVIPLHRLTSLSSLFFFAITILGIILAIILPYITEYIVPGFTESQKIEYITLTRILLVQPLFLGLASLFSCYAQLRNEFILYGIAPLLYSISIILAIIYAYPLYGVDGLIFGVVIGAFLSLLLQSISLRSLRIHHLKHIFSWSLTHEAIRLALPRTGTNAITQIRIIIFHGFATTLGPGMLSAYLFALRVTEAVTQVIQQSITTASIPVLSKEVVEGNMNVYKATVKRYVLLLGGVGIFISTIFFFVKEVIVAILYGTSDMNGSIVYFLVGALIALPFQMMSGYISISLYALKDTLSVMKSYLVASFIAVALLFMLPYNGMFLLMGVTAFFWVLLSINLFIFYTRKRV